MATILVSAYAVNPFKGSEDAMGWNFVLQIARHNKVIAITRKNNAAHIEKYFAEHPELKETKQRIEFLYFDWPKWMIFWKKGPVLSLIYYYFWQLTLAIWLKSKNVQFDIAHNLNFHNDWTPTFLWLLGKPMVWGPVGHHPKVPKQFLLPQFGMKEYIKDRFLWVLKNIFWNLDPMLYIAKKKAAMIYCMSKEAVAKMRLTKNYIIHPSVACEEAEKIFVQKEKFRILSVGRFVPLKGFDVTIRSFAQFYHSLSAQQQDTVQLTLVGSGPLKQYLKKLIKELKIDNVTNIIEWLPRNQLPELYASSSVFLFPSHEGAGMVVPEAMSYGLPVVCMNNCGPGELVHPATSLRVNYDTYDNTIAEIATKLEILFTNDILNEQEQLLSLQRYENMFRWNVRGDLLQGIYQDILKNNQ